MKDITLVKSGQSHYYVCVEELLMSLHELSPRNDQSLRVLLIDSDPAHLDHWSALLSYAGYDVRCARSCSDAALRLCGIHCILLDHRLPDMSGVEFIRHMSVSGTPAFVLFTDEPSALVHLAALQAGAALTLSKPSSLHAVLN